MDASVIIPVYNQKDALKKCIMGFQRQIIPKELTWEVIIVNDGSTDNVENDENIEKILKMSDNFSYRIITINHGGRAVARNVAINEARGAILIFCDGDRIPEKNFVQKHIETLHHYRNAVCIGDAMDFWGRDFLFREEDKKKARNTRYFNCILSLYAKKNKEGYRVAVSNLAWLSLLIGNASIHKSTLEKAGNFDEKFVTWGFEHFELGYRLQQNGVLFVVNDEIISYHQVHSHEPSEISSGLEMSIDIIREKHKSIDVESLYQFFRGEISIQEFQRKVNDKNIENIEKKFINSPWKERDNNGKCM